jgi:hypothetical protein
MRPLFAVYGYVVIGCWPNYLVRNNQTNFVSVQLFMFDAMHIQLTQHFAGFRRMKILGSQRPYYLNRLHAVGPSMIDEAHSTELLFLMK